MDEYLYLSNPKLRGFIPDEPRWWSRLRVRKFRASIKVAQVDLEIDDPDQLAVQLRKAENHTSGIGRWYEESKLTAGEWMFFEGRIGCYPVALEPAPGAVLFCQLGPGDRRIVLHGSAANLVESAQHPGDTPQSVPGLPMSDPSRFPQILKAAGESALPGPERAFWRRFANTPADHGPAEQDLAQHLAILFDNVVGTEWFQASAPYLAGWARVSGLVTLPNRFEVVVGSPLFVRRARPS